MSGYDDDIRHIKAANEAIYWTETCFHGCISGAMRIPREHIQACHSGIEPARKHENSSELLAATERIDSETEFIILASNGIFEVTSSSYMFITWFQFKNSIKHVFEKKQW